MKKRIFKLMFALVAIATTAQAQEDTIDGHEYVDLGLPSGTLWATCNVGASKPEEYGLYFAWGETKGYTSDTSDGHSFDEANYKWCKQTKLEDYCATKYCNDIVATREDTAAVLIELGVASVEEADAKTLQEKLDYILADKLEVWGLAQNDNKTELDLEDDAAYVNWGSNWRMPSLDQIEELIDNCNWEWTTQNGIYGKKATSKTNGNSIFLPAASYRLYTSLFSAGSDGDYWSRSLYTGYSVFAFYLSFDSGRVDCYHNDRCYGRSVRPVRR